MGLTCSAELKTDYAARMEATTRRLLDQLAAAKVLATFYIVGEIAKSHPQLVRDIHTAGHEVGSHSWDHRRVHHFTPESFPRRSSHQQGRARTGHRFGCVRVSRADVQRDERDGLGNRRAGGVRVRVRQFDLPGAARPLRHPGRAAWAVPRRGARSRDPGVTAADVPRRGAEFAGRGRRLLPPVPARGDEGRVAAGGAASARTQPRRKPECCTSTRGNSIQSNRDCRSSEWHAGGPMSASAARRPGWRNSWHSFRFAGRSTWRARFAQAVRNCRDTSSDAFCSRL